MILVTIKHMGGKKPDFENRVFTTREKATEWLRENGFAPGVNWLVKYQCSVPKEYLLVETTEIEPDAGEASRFRGFLDKEPQ